MEERKKLFEIMRNDLETMAEYGDDESALYTEIMAADNEIIESYKSVFMG